MADENNYNLIYVVPKSIERKEWSTVISTNLIVYVHLSDFNCQKVYQGTDINVYKNTN